MTTPDYSQLTPDCVLNALESIGLRCDGRLLALNSYENRVYQVGMDEGAPRVAKFYRPARWSDDAILEEHAFVQELVEREIPVVPASVIDGKTLHHFDGFRFSVFEKHGRRNWKTATRWNGWGASSGASTRSARSRIISSVPH